MLSNTFVKFTHKITLFILVFEILRKTRFLNGCNIAYLRKRLPQMLWFCFEYWKKMFWRKSNFKFKLLHGLRVFLLKQNISFVILVKQFPSYVIRWQFFYYLNMHFTNVYIIIYKYTNIWWFFYRKIVQINVRKKIQIDFV